MAVLLLGLLVFVVMTVEEPGMPPGLQKGVYRADKRIARSIGKVRQTREGKNTKKVTSGWLVKSVLSGHGFS